MPSMSLRTTTAARPISLSRRMNPPTATRRHRQNPAVKDGSEPSSSIAAAVDGDVISEPFGETTVTENDRGGVVEEVHTSHSDEHEEVESVGAEDALEEIRNRRKPIRRNYKIQEVVKRRQILLVQVVKEERGNKGAALTTYLSLAGRYSVLMPNTARGGGISRKITNAQDRKRLKEVVQDLDVPQGMGVILRTAGESRTKAEIKRDYEYLMRLWENVRSLTLQSTAPALVYEEGSLIKRSVRDLYNKDIDEILVAGEDGYREAKDFMRMLMPSHAKSVQPYRDNVPIFARNGIEAQLDRMLQPQVTLKSGGYIIINQTEALVAIDVNSGRSTKEHSIEDTALQTNLEAAEEVARQLRLRDLAGLIVIDFIDMEENRNNRSVEKRLKDCLKNDRARIQVGRISHFGLLEMSRQRIRASVLESTMKPCPHCGGTGHVRSDSSVALHVVRAIEEFLLKDSRSHITVKTPTATTLYVLNHKRGTLVELERRFGVTITVEADETLGAQHYAIFRGAIAEKPVGHPDPLTALPAYPEPEDEIEVESIEEEELAEAPAERPARAEPVDPNGQARSQSRSQAAPAAPAARRQGSRTRAGHAARGRHAARSRRYGRACRRQIAKPARMTVSTTAPISVEAGTPAETAASEADRKKRRRGKRGGKRNRPQEAGSEVVAGDTGADIDTGVGCSCRRTRDRRSRGGRRDRSGTCRRGTGAGGRSQGQAAARAAPHQEGDCGGAGGRSRGGGGGERGRCCSRAGFGGRQRRDAGSARACTTQAARARGRRVGRKPRPSRRKPASDDAAPVQPVVVSTAGPVDESKPKKAGWWQRKGFF